MFIGSIIKKLVLPWRSTSSPRTMSTQNSSTQNFSTTNSSTTNSSTPYMTTRQKFAQKFAEQEAWVTADMRAQAAAGQASYHTPYYGWRPYYQRGWKWWGDGRWQQLDSSLTAAWQQLDSSLTAGEGRWGQVTAENKKF